MRWGCVSFLYNLFKDGKDFKEVESLPKLRNMLYDNLVEAVEYMNEKLFLVDGWKKAGLLQYYTDPDSEETQALVKRGMDLMDVEQPLWRPRRKKVKETKPMPVESSSDDCDSDSECAEEVEPVTRAAGDSEDELSDKEVDKPARDKQREETARRFYSLREKGQVRGYQKEAPEESDSSKGWVVVVEKT
eukprot:GHVR01133656.1.p1 GENE.GHVR01133656.1~~GHVR01133656.1.p1  ORF type:complete len:189 (+),score=40.78 GHVR01133656.1:158-724(+)